MTSPKTKKRTRIYGNSWQNYETLCLAISVGKPVHEGDDLDAAIGMLVNIGKPVIIRLSDTLQRHNLMIEGMDHMSAFHAALDNGDAWLDRNAKAIKRLGPSTKIIRWGEVLLDHDFVSIHSAFIKLSRHNETFKEAMERDVSRFMARRAGLSEATKTGLLRCSRAFLVEEIAGQTLLGRRLSYARFYPGNPPESLSLVHAGKIDGAPTGLENTGLIRFGINSRKTSSE
jgi:hypothetical protein